jgi:hypothetical protein
MIGGLRHFGDVMEELPPSPLEVFWTTDYIPRWQLAIYVLWLLAVIALWPVAKAYFAWQNRQDRKSA